jgi:hypothetical protein
VSTFILADPATLLRPNPTSPCATGDLDCARLRERIGGRLTLSGGAHVERILQDLVRKAAKVVLASVPAANLKALVLGGSCGRGEGGIRVEHVVERASSSLDFVLFTTGLKGPARTHLASKISAGLQSLRRRSGLVIDLRVADARRVERDRARLLWYEVRDGHKLLAGDPAFLESLTRFTVENVDARDLADLVVNRGALLVMNDLITAQGPLTPERREAVVANTVKAVIGYGDALLFSRGRYHASYVERRRRMADRSNHATPEFKALYEAAMHHRFTGDPKDAERLLTAVETGRLRQVLRDLHLEIERRRLGARRLTFDDYIRPALEHELDDLKSSLRKLAKGALILIRGGFGRGGGSPYSLQVALHASGEKGAPRALFPLIAYGGDGDTESGDALVARRLLGVRRLRSAAAKLLWLDLWSKAFRQHYTAPLKRLGIRVDAQARDAA